VPQVTREPWSDWSGQQACTPVRVSRPRSEDELAGAVRRAAADGLVVRPVGSGHSFSPVCVTGDVQLDVAHLDGTFEVDDVSGVATVPAGMTMRRLSAELHARGRALTILGDVDTQTVAGALATGTHGTGAAFGNLSTAMVGGRLIGADGAVHDLATEPELLLAARVSLGALGVLSQVRLRTVPAFRLEKVEQPRPLADLLDDLDAVVASGDHVELYALPWSRRALLLTSRRTDEPATPPARWRTWLTDELVNNTGLGLLQRTGRRFPVLNPAVGRLTGAVASGSRRLDDSHKVFVSNRRVRFTESEWSLPRAAAVEAVREVMALVERRRLPVTFPVELRFAAADDALLSTASGRDSAYVAVHQFVGVDDSAYFGAVEDVMLGLDGRPHWGKKHSAGAEVLASRYPGWARFQAVRDRLDPTGVFTNPHLAHVLGAPAALRGVA
jgi:FAD-linked oxidoreductase